jgi:hypothetical protein
MKRGLITLADLPALAGGKNPRSQIVVARLGKYSNARDGKFEISEADYEGWKQNLSTIFGGRVSVDFDHSSDRGRGTEVRDKSYLYISPTYTAHYKDEHGIDRGRFDGVAVPRQAKKRNSGKATPARIQARGAVSARGCSTGHGRPVSRGSYPRASTFATPWPVERARWVCRGTDARHDLRARAQTAGLRQHLTPRSTRGATAMPLVLRCRV